MGAEPPRRRLTAGQEASKIPSVLRRAAALAIVAVIAIGIAGAAGGATPARSYLRVAAGGEFVYTIEYGSDPAALFNDRYVKIIDWTMNGIAVYDGKNLGVARGDMLVLGSAQIFDRRTQRVGQTGTRKPVPCTAPGVEVDPTDGVREWTSGTKNIRAVLSGGRVSLGGGSVGVDPGPGFKWNIGCAATEALPNHGLPGGPSFKVPAPDIPGVFAGTKVLSIACQRTFQHLPEESGNPSHSFDGKVRVWVRFRPFPESKLSATRTALRERVGKDISESTSNKRWQKCI